MFNFFCKTKKPNVEEKFFNACAEGSIVKAKLMRGDCCALLENYSYTKMKEVFLECCVKGHLEVAMWLWETWGHKLHLERSEIYLEYVLMESFVAESFDIVKWMCTLRENWRYDEKNNELKILPRNCSKW
jgi:hypothetical protein